jgi:CubicO group peptidase (beta-lactamase class C family)
MKKLLKRSLLVIALLLILAIAYVSVFFTPVMMGMAAKTVCSCVYISGRSVESVRERELQVFPGLSSSKIELQPDSSIVASMLWSSAKAIYRKGLGCTLLAERSEEEVRNQKFLLPTPPSTSQDTIAWPNGNLITDSLISDVNYERIQQILDSAFINDVSKPLNTYGIVVLYGDQIIGEQYAEGFNERSKLMGWSMGKSITSALIGILVRDGKLSLVDQAPVDEWKNDDRASIKLYHLLQANTGLEWSESYFNPHSTFHQMFMFRDDKGGYALGQKLKHVPGEVFQYSSGTTNILSKIIRQKTGDSSYYKFPYERLFYKIGMRSVVLEPDAAGTFVGSSYPFATARDWARFGLLYLNDGYWYGDRILPEGYVAFTTTPSTAALRGEYGAQWWLNAGEANNPSNRIYPNLPPDAFWADGFEEQYVMVIPSKNLVVVRLGASHHGSPFEKMVADIIQCLPEENQ